MFARVRFPTSASGHYADFWLRLQASGFTEAAIELQAMCRGYFLAVGLEPKPLDLSSNRPRGMEEHHDDVVHDQLRKFMKEHSKSSAKESPQ